MLAASGATLRVKGSKRWLEVERRARVRRGMMEPPRWNTGRGWSREASCVWEYECCVSLRSGKVDL